MAIEFHPGSVYIIIDGEKHEFEGIVQNIEFEVEGIPQYVKPHTGIEVACTVHWNREQLYKLWGVWRAATTSCPNRRVVALMNHKRKKIRMKNFYRAMRILQKGKCE